MPFVDDFPAAVKSTDHIVDAIFGWLCSCLLVQYLQHTDRLQASVSLARSASHSRP